MDGEQPGQDQRAVGFVLDAADVAVELFVDLPTSFSSARGVNLEGWAPFPSVGI
jgi:hypothetical protein